MKPRRWFRYSLRTFFVLITLGGCAMWWLRVQMKWINDRHEAAKWEYVIDHGGYVDSGPRISMEDYDAPTPTVVTPAPWSIRILGEPGYRKVWVVPVNEASPTATDKEAFRRVKVLFPEAEVSFWSSKGGGGFGGFIRGQTAVLSAGKEERVAIELAETNFVVE